VHGVRRRPGVPVRRRRQALIGGIVHRVKWKATELTAGRTYCHLAYLPGKGPWPNRRIQPGEATSRPVDCMACIAEGVS
jgi:hypothetical protein